MFSSSDLVDHACLQSETHYQPRPASSDVCLHIGLSHKCSYWLNVSGASYNKNPKEGIQGFPVVPNMSEENPKEFNSNKCDL